MACPMLVPGHARPLPGIEFGRGLSHPCAAVGAEIWPESRM